MSVTEETRNVCDVCGINTMTQQTVMHATQTTDRRTQWLHMQTEYSEQH